LSAYRRCLIENINDIKKYEFFAGHDATGKPMWTGDFTKIKPLLDWNNNMGVVTVTYDAPLKKYLMCVTHGWPTVGKFDTMILESSRITGPFRLVTYMKRFGEQGYFVNFPSKFISKDGRTAWLSFSANFMGPQESSPKGDGYAWCLHEVQLLKPER
jgi:hypothetical protein